MITEFCLVEEKPVRSGSASFDLMLQPLDDRVENQGNQTQHHKSCDQVIEFEDLAGVDDQISKTFSGCEKFTDDHTHQTETDVDFENTDHCRQTGRKDHIAKRCPLSSAKSMDQLDFLTVCFPKSSVHTDDTAEDGHGHACSDDGAAAASQPYDQEWCQCRFWKTVEDDQPGLQYLRDSREDPQKGSCQKTDPDDKQEADQRLIQGDFRMEEERTILTHGG